MNFESDHIKHLKMHRLTCSFNTGVYVFNIDKWRSENVTQDIEHWMILNTKWVVRRFSTFICLQFNSVFSLILFSVGFSVVQLYAWGWLFLTNFPKFLKFWFKNPWVVRFTYKSLKIKTTFFAYKMLKFLKVYFYFGFFLTILWIPVSVVCLCTILRISTYVVLAF